MRWALLFFVLLSRAAAWPQTAPKKNLPLPEKFLLLSVTVTGSARYQPQDILAQTDLKAGQTCDEGDFRLATNRLGSTGVFSEVSYTYDYSPAGANLKFQVRDSTELVPARFDNLIWFSDQELRDALHAKVPLFAEQLPVEGNLAQQVSDALQNLLVGKKIQGEADFIRYSEPDGPVQAVVFRVVGPRIRIQGLTFPGANPEETIALQNAAQVLIGQTYSRSNLHDQAQKTLLPVLMAKGYLKAEFAESSATIFSQEESEILVNAVLPVNRGQQYRLESYQVEGSKIFTRERVDPVIHLRENIGKPVDFLRLQQDLAAIRQLCGTKGYIAADVQAQPAFSNDSLVTYHVIIHEGTAFYMGDVDIQGLDENTTARLREEWALRPGQAYDSSYPQKFLEQSSRDIPLLKHLKADFVETPNDKQKTVDVTLRFLPEPH
jgi:outer membrane protein assembly factor BamA